MTDQWVDEYRAADASGLLEDKPPIAQVAAEGRAATLNDSDE